MDSIIPKLLVLDTNVCLDLFVFQDTRWASILRELQTGDLKAITRQDCRDEWLAVLKYPHLPIQPEQLLEIMQRFDTHIECQNPPVNHERRLPVCSDKDDQKFLEIARDAQVDTLITKDKALLKLARKVQNLGMFKIQTPEKFLQNHVTSCDQTAVKPTKE